MKMKLDSHDELPPNKIVKISIIAIVARVIFHENNKYHPQAFLDECQYEI